MQRLRERPLFDEHLRHMLLDEVEARQRAVRLKIVIQGGLIVAKIAIEQPSLELKPRPRERLHAVVPIRSQRVEFVCPRAIADAPIPQREPCGRVACGVQLLRG